MKNYILIFLLSFYFSNSFAQDPNWSFNVSEYQFNMSFTASLNINGSALSSTNDKVAAFINGEVRGVASVTYVASSDKYVFYLSVFSKSPFGETINFKIYDSVHNKVVQVSRTNIFQLDKQVGSLFQSFSLAAPSLNTTAAITSFSFDSVQEKSVNISDSTIDILVPTGTDINNLVANFTTSPGSSVFIEKVEQESNVTSQNFTHTLRYEVLSEDESTLRDYTVRVTISVIVSDLTVELTSNANVLVVKNPTEIQLTTSEGILSVKQEDFLLTNAAIVAITNIDATNYTISFMAISRGDFSIQVTESSINTAAGKVNNASNKLTFIYDSKAPFLVSVLRKLPTEATTNENSLEFTATFSEPVSNVLVSNFATVIGATLNLQKVNDATYTITVSNIDSYNGKVSLRLKSETSITDFSGNAIRTSIFKNY